MNPGKVQTFEVYQCRRGPPPSASKRRSDVTLEDITQLDSLSVAADDPFATSAAKYVSSIFDIAAFKPMKPLSKRDEHPAKRGGDTRRRARGRRLPFSHSPRPSADFQVGEAITLRRHSILDLEQDYFKSLMDENGKFRKYAPLMECSTELLAAEFRVQLAEGRIWRTIRVEASTSFYLLRRAILDLMNWSESTSWSFIYVNRSNQITLIGQSGPMKSDEDIRNDEELIVIETLHESYCRFSFIYDLVKQWKVDLFLRKVVDRDEGELLPVCVRGRGVINLARIHAPQRLLKVCDVLRLDGHPKRGKYLDKYGDLLATVHVSDTLFPSFYSRPNEIVLRSSSPLRRRRKRGPFLIKWVPYPRISDPPKPQEPKTQAPKPQRKCKPQPKPKSPEQPVRKKPVFGIRFVEFPPLPVTSPATEPIEPAEEEKSPAEEEKSSEEQKCVDSLSTRIVLEIPRDILPVATRKRRRKAVVPFDPKPPEKRKRRPRSDGVLVVNFDPAEAQNSSG